MCKALMTQEAMVWPSKFDDRAVPGGLKRQTVRKKGPVELQLNRTQSVNKNSELTKKN